MHLTLLLLLFQIRFSQSQQKDTCTNLYDYPISNLSPNCYASGKTGATTPELIVGSGYTVESHTVTTTDGYILTMFRIPVAVDDSRRNKQPVYLQHGLFADSSSWVNTGERSLAFNLADQGYDVWLGSYRGTIYSDSHTNPNLTPDEFYSYNLDTIAAEDIRANLLYITKMANQSVFYIAHSEGNTLIYMFASEFPKEATDFLKAIVSLSPVVYFNGVHNPEIELAPFVGNLFKIFNQPCIFYSIEAIRQKLVTTCGSIPYVCRTILAALGGNSVQFLPEDFLNFWSRYPGRISYGEYYQFNQISVSGDFKKYDYGVTKNLEMYGQRTPPLYNLSGIEVPTVLYYGTNDFFTSNQSVTRLYNELGSTTKFLKSTPVGNPDPNYQFCHIDFYYSRYIQQFLYKDLLAVLADLS